MINDNEALYDGIILAVTADTDTRQVFCMRLKSSQGRYPIITYEEAVYTGLNKHHIGMAVTAREILPQELKKPEHAAVWEQYRRDQPDWEEEHLLYTGKGQRPRMFLHTLEDGSECLVAAGEPEIRCEPASRQRYWELGYHYDDMRRRVAW